MDKVPPKGVPSQDTNTKAPPDKSAQAPSKGDINVTKEALKQPLNPQSSDKKPQN